MKVITSLVLVFFTCTLLAGQSETGYHIQVRIDGYEQEQLFLGQHYGDKQYLLDTVVADSKGIFHFQGEEPKPCGVYLIILPPDNRYFQILLTEQEQHFSAHTNAADPGKDPHFTQAPDNELFYTYIHFLENQKNEATRIQELLDKEENEKKKEKLMEERNSIDEKVKTFQSDLIRQYPNTLTSLIVIANLPTELPTFEEQDEKELQMKRWLYSKEHYFDNLNLDNPCMLRTPFLFQKVDQYVQKMVIQHPDTISKAIDEVLEKMKPAEETFKFYLIHFLGFYARSNIVGMDAVYVHLVDRYYATGQAPWTEEEQLNKIIDNAKALKPLLIGKIAPDIQLQTRDGQAVRLHEVDAEYTVLYFWRYDCGHCKKTTPEIKEFYEKFKDKGIKVVAICAKFSDELPDCWKYVEENEIGDWMHLVDPYHRSRFMTIYNIKTTPQIYILDRNKEILSKRLGGDQLEEVIDKIIEMREKENQGKE